MTYEQFVSSPPWLRRFALTHAYLGRSFTDLAIAFGRFASALGEAERRAHKADPGLAEALRFEREYFTPDAGWLDVAAARESGRTRHPLVWRAK